MTYLIRKTSTLDGGEWSALIPWWFPEPVATRNICPCRMSNPCLAARLCTTACRIQLRHNDTVGRIFRCKIVVHHESQKHFLSQLQNVALTFCFGSAVLPSVWTLSVTVLIKTRTTKGQNIKGTARLWADILFISAGPRATA